MSPLSSSAALVVIDVQRGFDDGSWGPRNNADAEANIARLLGAWRATSRPVRHVHHDSSSPKGSFVPGTAGNEPKDEARPVAGEPVYRKRVNSGFIGTALEADLRRDGVTELIIVGLTTNHCVSTTTRMAGNLGFETFIVSDATATFDRANVDGSMRAAQDVHDAALSDLSEEFATVVTTAQILEAA
jgi:nicotinamidase-related amidase